MLMSGAGPAMVRSSQRSRPVSLQVRSPRSRTARHHDHKYIHQNRDRCSLHSRRFSNSVAHFLLVAYWRSCKPQREFIFLGLADGDDLHRNGLAEVYR